MNDLEKLYKLKHNLASKHDINLKTITLFKNTDSPFQNGCGEYITSSACREYITLNIRNSFPYEAKTMMDWSTGYFKGKHIDGKVETITEIINRYHHDKNYVINITNYTVGPQRRVRVECKVKIMKKEHRLDVSLIIGVLRWVLALFPKEWRVLNNLSSIEEKIAFLAFFSPWGYPLEIVTPTFPILGNQSLMAVMPKEQPLLALESLFEKKKDIKILAQITKKDFVEGVQSASKHYWWKKSVTLEDKVKSFIEKHREMFDLAIKLGGVRK